MRTSTKNMELARVGYNSMRQDLNFVAVLAIAAAAPLLGAIPNPLQSACASADAVIVGTVNSQPAGAVADSPLVSVGIDSVIRGDFTPGSSLLVKWPGLAVAVRGEPYRALLFLVRPPGGGWQIMPIGGPKGPLAASAVTLVPGVEVSPQASRKRVTRLCGRC